MDDVLPNDIARANYVHWIMDQVVSAPDYDDVQNKIFLIDGMVYDDGRSHTSADYHAVIYCSTVLSGGGGCRSERHAMGQLYSASTNDR